MINNETKAHIASTSTQLLIAYYVFINFNKTRESSEDHKKAGTRQKMIRITHRALA